MIKPRSRIPAGCRPRVVHFVDNAEAEREPDARTAERATDHVLGATGPCRRNARTTWRLAKRWLFLIVHAVILHHLARRVCLVWISQPRRRVCECVFPHRVEGRCARGIFRKGAIRIAFCDVRDRSALHPIADMRADIAGRTLFTRGSGDNDGKLLHHDRSAFPCGYC